MCWANEYGGDQRPAASFLLPGRERPEQAELERLRKELVWLKMDRFCSALKIEHAAKRVYRSPEWARDGVFN